MFNVGDYVRYVGVESSEYIDCVGVVLEHVYHSVMHEHTQVRVLFVQSTVACNVRFVCNAFNLERIDEYEFAMARLSMLGGTDG